MSEVGPGYHLFCEPMSPLDQAAPREPSPKKLPKNQPAFNRAFRWSVSTKAPVVAMALTNEVLYVAIAIKRTKTPIALNRSFLCDSPGTWFSSPSCDDKQAEHFGVSRLNRLDVDVSELHKA